MIGDRLRIEKSLPILAAEVAQVPLLFRALDAFGHHLELERATQCHHRRSQRTPVRSLVHSLHEAAIDLQDVERILRQIAK